MNLKENSMKAYIYPHGSNVHGYFVQRENCTKVLENVTKKQLMNIADLRHNVLTKNEYYNLKSTDNGVPKKEFELLGNGMLIVVKR